MTKLNKYKYTRSQLEDVVKKSVSISGVMRNLGIKRTQGGNHSHIRSRILKEGIDTSHFTGSADYRVVSNRKLTPDIILVIDRNNGTRESIGKLRWALDQVGRARVCAICGSGEEWLGGKLVLEINHINSNPCDNREINLEYLCPNCHQQVTFRVKVSNAPKIYDRKGSIYTPLPEERVSKQVKARTKKSSVSKKICPVCGVEYTGVKSQISCSDKCGYARRRRFQIDKESLQKMVWEIPTTKIAEKFGVSDKAVEKRCRSLGVDKPPRGYWAKVSSGKINALVGERQTRPV